MHSARQRVGIAITFLNHKLTTYLAVNRHGQCAELCTWHRVSRSHTASAGTSVLETSQKVVFPASKGLRYSHCEQFWGRAVRALCDLRVQSAL
jgi:hypothetical protein